MALNPAQQEEIFQKLIASELAPEEVEQLVDWLGSGQVDPVSEKLILAQLSLKRPDLDGPAKQVLEERLQQILELTQEEPAAKKSFVLLRYWKVAASIAIIFSLGIIFFPKGQQPNPNILSSNIPAKDIIQPGKDGAILTMADGRQIILDSLGNGIVANEDGSSILMKGGELLYQPQPGSTETVYNMITTPKGRQFRLQLADGTKVWLNAASSLRYPAVFTGSERVVEVEGEVYFEVAKHTRNDGSRVPFKVKINESTQVEVLGTHFNINAYKDEAEVNTTLLEGSIKMVKGGAKEQLVPGQQARLKATTVDQSIQVIDRVNIDKVMAWKNGLFDFDDATLEEVMRQLERWYDIEVVYEKNVPKVEFFGKMGKDLSLETVLQGLAKSNVRFRIEEGRKLVVLP